jgi:hypothetical protein
VSESAAQNLAARLRSEVSAAQAAQADYISGLEAATGVPVRGLRGVQESLDGGDPVLAVLTDTSQPAATRLELLQRLAAQLSRRDDCIAAMLAIVRDRDDDLGVRAAALAVLGSAAFQVARFRPHRRMYDDVLHDLVDDPDPALRETAVTTLAQERDPVVQRVLLEGLQEDRPLPVDREHAVRLLAEDDHLDVLPLLQDMYRDGSEDARQEAVRFMGSYPDARETLESILRDRNESPEVRQQSAASLRYLAPESYEAAAKEIAIDSGDDPDVRTASFSALQHLGDLERVYGDTDFVDHVEAVSREEATPQVAQVARELLDRRPST